MLYIIGSGDVPLAHCFAEFNKFSDGSQHVVDHARQSSFERKSEKKAKKLGSLRYLGFHWQSEDDRWHSATHQGESAILYNCHQQRMKKGIHSDAFMFAPDA